MNKNQEVARQDSCNKEIYKLRVKIGGDEFDFECPDKHTLVHEGIELLGNTFGRYKPQDIRARIKKSREEE
ncbi:hypothetical protein GF362_04685 [Candidatus Dojkabacteria bacterium]|nr:hypothetical protein [Candidatus Dojkabacteria bacterium]